MQNYLYNKCTKCFSHGLSSTLGLYSIATVISVSTAYAVGVVFFTLSADVKELPLELRPGRYALDRIIAYTDFTQKIVDGSDNFRGKRKIVVEVQNLS